ncbi:PHP domain-containing protein [Paenibacillus larvae]|nr:PHP domain-containing protein [Paenibacillus larvae]MDT2242816.1 PHP domain-containing protein [Paenibacillus larvae]
MRFDLHTHHERCGHATGTIRHYIEAAIEKGLSVIGISDHSPYFASEEDQLHPNIAMAKSEFARYVEEVLELKKEYAEKIEVLLGVESDFSRNQLIFTVIYMSNIHLIILSVRSIIREASAFLIKRGGEDYLKQSRSNKRNIITT